MIVRPPGLPVSRTMLPVPFDNRRRRGAEHSFARGDEVRVRADLAALDSCEPGYQLKSPISLFSRKPAPRTTTRAPYGLLDRVGVADGHAVAIEDREMGRALALVRLPRKARMSPANDELAVALSRMIDPASLADVLVVVELVRGW